MVDPSRAREVAEGAYTLTRDAIRMNIRELFSDPADYGRLMVEPEEMAGIAAALHESASLIMWMASHGRHPIKEEKERLVETETKAFIQLYIDIKELDPVSEE